MRREVSYYIREKKRTASTELAHVLKKCIGQIDRPWKEIIILPDIAGKISIFTEHWIRRFMR